MICLRLISCFFINLPEKLLGIKIKNFVLDTLFPIRCLFCGAPDIWLCPICLTKIKILPSQVCPYCEKVFTEGGTVCPACKINFWKKNERPPLDGLVVAAKYADLARPIHAFKYNFVRDLANPLGNLLTKAAAANDLPLPDIIIPVPLHRRRLRWRGFNQAELLARYIADNLTPGFPLPVFSDLVVRKKYTPPQMKIKNYRQRQANLKHAFSLNAPTPRTSGISGKTVLLVDDVSTTGSTLLECAKVLKSGGAKKVFALVLSRQEMGKKK